MGASEQAVLNALGVLVRDQGWEVTDDPVRLRGMLSDLLGVGVDVHRGLLDAVVVSAREGIPDAVRAAGPGGLGNVRDDLIAELEEWGLTTARAAWVVDAWRGLAPEPTLPPPETEAPEPETVPAAEPTVLPEEPAPMPAFVPTYEPVRESEPVAEPTALPQPARVAAVGEVGSTALPVPVPATALPLSDDDPPTRTEAPGGRGGLVEPLAADITHLPAPDPVHDPDSVPVPGDATRRTPAKRGLVLALVGVLVLAGAGVAAARALTGDDPATRSEVTSTPSGSPDAETAASDPGATDGPPPGPPAARGDELVAAPRVRPDPSDGTFAMAGSEGGVRVAALSDVEEFGSGSSARGRPANGRLIAFRLTDWRCDVPPCRPWSKLDLDVVVGKDVRTLPDGQGTFVVAVPRRDLPVELRMRGDGLTQTLSLRNGRPGAANVAVLARDDRATDLDRSFSLTESLSTAVQWPNGVVSSTATRAVTVRSAELGYFGYARRPRSPDWAILAVDAFFTRPWDADPAAFLPAEIVFRDVDGTRYEAFDVNPDPARMRLGFEVPAGLERGTLVFGGQVAFGGSEPLTRTLSTREVPVRFS